MWDLPHEELCDLNRDYFMDADAAIIVVDVEASDFTSEVEKCVAVLNDAALARGGTLNGTGPRDLPTVIWLNKVSSR